MKKTFSILLTLALVLSFSVMATTPVAAAPASLTVTGDGSWGFGLCFMDQHFSTTTVDASLGDTILSGEVTLGNFDAGSGNDVWYEVGLLSDATYLGYHRLHNKGVYMIALWTGSEYQIHMQNVPGTKPDATGNYLGAGNCYLTTTSNSFDFEIKYHNVTASNGLFDLRINDGSGWTDWKEYQYAEDDAENHYSWTHEEAVAYGYAGDDDLTDARIVSQLFVCSDTTQTFTATYDNIEVNGTPYDLEPRVMNTDTGKGYAGIQCAIDDASAGDTIEVAAGTYRETGGPFYGDHYGLKFDGSQGGITLRGANAGIPGYGTRGPESIIEGPNVLHGNAVFIFDGADGVVIDGFTLKAVDDIVENRADNVVIKNNIITPLPSTSLSGTLTFTNGSTTVTGSGTSFTTELGVGWRIMLDADGVWAEVDSIASDIFLTLKDVYTGTGGTGAGSANPDPYAPGIFACECTNLTISYNYILNTGGIGMFLGSWWHSADITNSLITHNLVENSGMAGIMSEYSTGGLTIEHNTIKNAGDDGIRGWQHTSGMTIQCNEIYGSGRDGIRIFFDAASHHINHNSIYGSVGYGVNNKDTAANLDAENNWWGDTDGSGPYDPSDETDETTDVPPCSVSVAAMMNPDGAGDEVYGLVDYCPWLNYSAETTTGAGNASFTCSHGCVNNLTAVPTPPSQPVYLPYGVFSFNISCIDPGETVTVTVTLPGPVPVGSVWWKYQGGSWYWLPIGSDDGDNVITITLTDGGQGDEDGMANGQIIDDGGPGPLSRGLIVRSTEGGRVTKPGEGNHLYERGTVVKLVATPDDGYKFVEWTHDVRRIDDVNAASTTITMDRSYVIIANFVTEETSTVETEVQYELNISSTMGGSVASPGEGKFPYIEGTVVSLVASPDDGYKFVNWTGDGITKVDSTTTSITIDGDHSVMANFEFEQTSDTDAGEESSTSTPVGACFIATVAYGTPTAEQIDVLREFRDVVLLENSVGSQFVDLYYRLSPPIADFIAGNSFLRAVVRKLVVDPIVGVVEATGAIWRN